jgi:hypothetical protein
MPSTLFQKNISIFYIIIIRANIGSNNNKKGGASASFLYF